MDPLAGGKIVPLAKCTEDTCPLAIDPLTTASSPSMPLVMEPLAGGRIVPLANIELLIEPLAGGRIVPDAKCALLTCPLAMLPDTTAPSPMWPDCTIPDVSVKATKVPEAR